MKSSASKDFDHAPVTSNEDVKNLRAFAKVRRLSQRQAAKRLGRTLGTLSQKATRVGIRFKSNRRK